MGMKARVREPEPIEWVDAINGYLTLFALADALEWNGYGDGVTLEVKTLVDGVLALHENSLVLIDAAAATLIPTGNGAIAVLALPGSGDELVAAALVDGEWQETGAELVARGHGFVIFDAAASWPMIEGGLHAAVALPAESTFRVEYRDLGRGHALRLSEV